MNFTVRDAGEVEIERDGDRLILIEARPNPGWELEAEDEEDEEDEDDEEEEEEEDEDDDDDEEIEVTFVQGDREVEFEAEIDDGRLAIEIEETWRGIDPGSFTVADAGEVEIRRDGDRLIMVGVIANEGWDFEVEHEDDEDDSGDTVEFSFVSGDREAEFEAKIEDGVLEVEIETREYVDEARS
jgi:virulence-associated protein VagC